MVASTTTSSTQRRCLGLNLGLVDRRPKQPQGHCPKHAPDHGAEYDHRHESNEQAYLGDPSLAGVGVFGDVPYLIDWQSQGDQKSIRDASGGHEGILMPRGPNLNEKSRQWGLPSDPQFYQSPPNL